jgi:hypothetical protein
MKELAAGHEKQKLGVYRALPSKEIGQWTLGLIWDEMTPSLMARVIRDCIQLSNLCRMNRTKMNIATTNTALDRYLKFINVERTAHLASATYWRAYVIREVPEIPEHAKESEIIYIQTKADDPQLLVHDPEFPGKVWYPIFPIPETMPLNRTPPSGKPDPFSQSDPF